MMDLDFGLTDDTNDDEQSTDSYPEDQPWTGGAYEAADDDWTPDDDSEPERNAPSDNQFGNRPGGWSEEDYPVVDQVLENIAEDFDGPDDFENAVLGGSDPRVDPQRHDITNDGKVDLFDVIEFRKANAAGGFDPAKWARPNASRSDVMGSDSSTSGGSDTDGSGAGYQEDAPWHSGGQTEAADDDIDWEEVDTPDDSGSDDPVSDTSSGSGMVPAGIDGRTLAIGAALVAVGWGVMR